MSQIGTKTCAQTASPGYNFGSPPLPWQSACNITRDAAECAECGDAEDLLPTTSARPPAALITLAGYFPAACQRDQFSSKLVQADGYGFDPRLPGVTTVVWLEPLFVVTVMPP
jgi:hypothetical protein